jgi:ABC-type transport system involved in multi-copper enzyme maturation permease subunit
MRNVGAVALNTFREAVRDRVLYNLVLFAFLIIAAAIFVGQISIGIEDVVMVSLGLGAISFIGLLIAVFIGVGLVYKEMDKRTLYALLAKPVRRWEFVLGKFGGLLLTLAINAAAMTVALLVAIRYVKHSFGKSELIVLLAVYFIVLKLAIVIALALLFSSITTPLLSILYTSGLYIAGQFISEMRTLRADLLKPALADFLRWISYLLPNFANFDIAVAAAHGRAVPGSLILENTLYAALYCAIALGSAVAVFSRRDLK